MTHDNIIKLIEEANKNNYDILVPKRQNLSTVPKFQKWIESRANKKICEELGKQNIELNEILDLWFGPKFFTKKGAEYFLNYKGKLDKWDAIIKPVVNALKDGLKVGSVEVDYSYDKTQSKNEGDSTNRQIREKRVEQYRMIVREILGNETTTL